MGYDISLLDPVSKDEIELPVKHLMLGNNYIADYDSKTGQFTPKPTSNASLGITYNYSRYYYEATENDKRFYGKDEYDDKNDEPTNRGIRGIYGKTGAESIPMLKDMIQRITDKYQKDGKWIITTRIRVAYYKTFTNEEIHVIETFNMKPNEWYRKEITEDIYEGVNEDYWESTAGNAIRPLYKLIAMAELRPDGIWDGD